MRFRVPSGTWYVTIAVSPDGRRRQHADPRRLQAVGVPLIIWGCGIDDKDSQILPAVSAAARGENCLLGTARQSNYRTIVAVCHADHHKLLAESPLKPDSTDAGSVG